MSGARFARRSSRFGSKSTLSKQQILELYLNSIFLGRNAYGVQAASRAYFDKDVNELTLPEAAYLAVLPRAPANYDPVRATQRALDRRNYVLREMARNGYITNEQRDAASTAPLGTIRYGSSEKFRQQGGYFMEEVRREIIKQFGEGPDKGSNSLYAGGLWVRTSMVPTMQDAAAQSLRDGLTKFDGGRGWRDTELSVNLDKGDWAAQLDRAPVGVGYPDWSKAVVLSKSGGQAMIGFTNGSTGFIPASGASMPVRGVGGSAFDALRPGMIVIVKQLAPGSYGLRSIPEISGGMLVEEVHTGRVLAMQGGFDVVGSSYNRATQALRQPGSAFKPIVYTTALANGMTPASIIVDAPFCVWQGAGLGNKCFVNFDRRYAGPHTMRWGVEQSRNLMTVRAASETGMLKVIDTAQRLGVGKYPNYLSIALGAGDTTVLRLVNAYATLANQGRSVRPTTIDFVQDRHGKVIYRTDNRCAVMGNCNAPDWDGKAMPRPPSRTKQLVDAMAAFQMVHIMEGVVERGTAIVLRDLNRPLFGKTGTTSGPTNVWFVGGTPDIVAGVYMGYDQPRSMGGYAQGGRIAAPIFKEWAQTALKDQPKVPFVAPAGIVDGRDVERREAGEEGGPLRAQRGHLDVLPAARPQSLVGDEEALPELRVHAGEGGEGRVHLLSRAEERFRRHGQSRPLPPRQQSVPAQAVERGLQRPVVRGAVRLQAREPDLLPEVVHDRVQEECDGEEEGETDQSQLAPDTHAVSMSAPHRDRNEPLSPGPRRQRRAGRSRFSREISDGRGRGPACARLRSSRPRGPHGVVRARRPPRRAARRSACPKAGRRAACRRGSRPGARAAPPPCRPAPSARSGPSRSSAPRGA